MNSVTESLLADWRRNSGGLWRSAFTTTRIGGCDAAADGAQPGAESAPEELGEADGEVLQQSLGRDAGPDEDLTAVDLSLDGLAVLERLAVEMLVAVAAA